AADERAEPFHRVRLHRSTSAHDRREWSGGGSGARGGRSGDGLRQPRSGRERSNPQRPGGSGGAGGMNVPFLDLAAMHHPLAERFQEAWDSVVTTSGFIGGRHVEDFEQRWAEYCGTEEAIGVANGTDALRLTLAALGIGPGDEVIVPTNT